MNIGFSSILKHIPFKPVHTYPEMFEKQEIFYESLEPLHEMEHQGKMYTVIFRQHHESNVTL